MPKLVELLGKLRSKLSVAGCREVSQCISHLVSIFILVMIVILVILVMMTIQCGNWVRNMERHSFKTW